VKLESVEIYNFRGIERAKVDLWNSDPGQVVTLIGLNESGKTTILEAISNFVSRDAHTRNLVETYYAKVEASSFVPKHRRGRFTETISIACDAVLTDDDIQHAAALAKGRTGCNILTDTFPARIKVVKAFVFKDSALIEQRNRWTMSFTYTKGKGKKTHRADSTTDVWQAVASALQGRLPEIVYFPTLLFDVPDRIYLEETDDETVENSYYRRVFSDILHEVDQNYSVQNHIIRRIRDAETASAAEKFFRALLGASIEGDVDTVIREVSNKASKEIIGAWDEIFDRKLVNKRIEFNWDLDPNKGNAIYIEPFIIDGQSKYLLRERSAGFRWFFSFLLFTQFRKARNSGRPTIYLFDEPAANLHSGAQMKLLDGFKRICGENDLIVYSTHSHYMVNPLWLEKAYIVENLAIDLSSDEADQFSTQPNDIKATSYKHFVAQNPNRLAYFRPVLDALKHQISPLEFRGPAVFLEGKYDFYPFVYLQDRLGAEVIASFPVNGAGDMGPLITLFRGWAVPFVVLLDSDKAGDRERIRYERDYDLGSSQILQLHEALPALKGQSFEGLFKEDVKAAIARAGVGRGHKLKEDASQLFQLLIATNDPSPKIGNTLKVFQKIHVAILERLAQQS
jgi:ABC-type Mn2+/Zn2+ transport system ATPase subunit